MLGCCEMSKVGNQTNSQDPQAINSRTFVGNLNTFQCTKTDVERMFQRYGRIAGEYCTAGEGDGGGGWYSGDQGWLVGWLVDVEAKKQVNKRWDIDTCSPPFVPCPACPSFSCTPLFPFSLTHHLSISLSLAVSVGVFLFHSVRKFQAFPTKPRISCK